MVRFAFTLTLALAALALPAAAAEPFKMMPADDVQKLLGTPGVHVFDANSRERFEQGHLPGAKHVTKKTLIESLPPNKEETLIFYCTNPR